MRLRIEQMKIAQPRAVGTCVFDATVVGLKGCKTEILTYGKSTAGYTN